MREILFRGQSIISGNWCYGYYFYKNHADKPTCYIMPKDRSTLCGLKIMSKTLGQFIEMVDKNGIKIFEGDIIRILGNNDIEDFKGIDYYALVVFKNGGFCAINGTEENHSFRRYDFSRCDFILEVVGNIHDNPDFFC